MYVETVRSADEMEQISADRYMRVTLSGERDHFTTRFAVHDLSDSISLSQVESSAIRLCRTRRMITESERDDLLLFCLHVSGSARIGQHDRTAAVPAGSAVVYEAGKPWRMWLPENSTSLTLQFPREFLPLRSSQIAEWCAVRLDPEVAPVRLLSSFLVQLHDLSDGLSADQRQDAAHAAIDLFAMALRGAVPTAPPAGSTACEQVLLGMIRLHVRDHLGDVRLGVEELAYRHHISVRRLHSLFAGVGGTPGAFIRRQRLDAAQRALSNPEYSSRSVEAIARLVGFTELRTFERAFKREYGTTPASWRREHVRADSVVRDADTVVPVGARAR